MVLDLMQEELFYFLVAGSVKISKIFGAEMGSSVNANNNTKNKFFFGKGIKQGLDDTTLTAEKNIQLISLDVIQNFV